MRPPTRKSSKRPGRTTSRRRPTESNGSSLGSLHIPIVDGVSVRVQANEEGVIQQVALMDADNALMLSVLAAPRNESVWDEARADIRKELSAGGASVIDVRDSEHGTALRARVQTPEGQVELRFVGVDGPRWLLRAVFQGPVAIDPAGGPSLMDSSTDWSSIAVATRCRCWRCCRCGCRVRSPNRRRHRRRPRRRADQRRTVSCREPARAVNRTRGHRGPGMSAESRPSGEPAPYVTRPMPTTGRSTGPLRAGCRRSDGRARTAAASAKRTRPRRAPASYA